jgi:hypothetical protein
MPNIAKCSLKKIAQCTDMFMSFIASYHPPTPITGKWTFGEIQLLILEDSTPLDPVLS